MSEQEMCTLEASLRQARDRGRKLLVPYITGGLGAEWSEVLQEISLAGADAVEVGIPFSDPVMDGPTIQEASERALAGGATPVGILSTLRSLDVRVPLVAMTYFNIAHAFGLDRFAGSLASSGVEGAILPDLPFCESSGWRAAASKAGVATILLAAPTTPDEDLAQIAEFASGFIYGVGVMGVTGERSRLASSATQVAKRLKAISSKPVLVGVGVSDPDQAREVCEVADGVIVGSALVRRLLEGVGPSGAAEFVSEIREALDKG